MEVAEEFAEEVESLELSEAVAIVGWLEAVLGVVEAAPEGWSWVWVAVPEFVLKVDGAVDEAASLPAGSASLGEPLMTQALSEMTPSTERHHGRRIEFLLGIACISPKAAPTCNTSSACYSRHLRPSTTL